MTGISKNQRQIILLALERSSQRLESQQVLATASDQKGLVFAGLCVAAAALATQITDSVIVTEAVVAASALYLLAGILSAISAISQAQFTAGDDGKTLFENLDNNDLYERIVITLVANNSNYIATNERNARSRTLLFSLSVFTFCVATTISLIGIMGAIK